MGACLASEVVAVINFLAGDRPSATSVRHGHAAAPAGGMSARGAEEQGNKCVSHALPWYGLGTTPQRARISSGLRILVRLFTLNERHGNAVSRGTTTASDCGIEQGGLAQ
jgi:hypothetical protein